MEKYRGFWLDCYDYSVPVKFWNGHSSERTGEYEIHSYIRVLNPRNGKTANGGDTIEDAKKAIDKFLDSKPLVKKEELSNLKKSIRNKEKTIRELTKEIERLERVIENSNIKSILIFS